MYVNLYPNKELKKTKRTLLWASIFMLCGGLAVLISELVAQEQVRIGWLVAATLVGGAGALGFAVGAGYIHLKDAFFSMTPERISYRLTLYGASRTIYWNSVDSILASENTLLFELKDSKQIVMRLGHIQSPEIANHVSVSIQLAAIQQNIEVNQVAIQPQRVNS